jgi:hypothetical protein
VADHTPGPWTWDELPEGRSGLLLGPGVSSVLDISDDWTCKLPNEADAHLIAAAPDLLAALENTLICVDERTEAAVIEHARAAIAKAKGES